jgi:hypothetical protein
LSWTGRCWRCGACASSVNANSPAAEAEPARLSAAAVIRAFQSTLRDYRLRPLRSDETLWAKLRAALRDDYRRKSSKTSGNYPRKKQRHAIGAPTILYATKQQTKLTKALTPSQPNLRLTAQGGTPRVVNSDSTPVP